MIRIEVTAYDGRPLAQALTAEFDELGGTIGRAEGSTLVLPDPKRYISRTHASVIFRGGSYVLRDIGSATPVVVNGKQLGAGREAPIRDGDVVAMANYTMRVIAAPVAVARPGAAPMAPAAVITTPSLPVKDDPLAAFGGDPSAANPFADLLAPSPGVPVAPDPSPPKRAEVAPKPDPAPARAPISPRATEQPPVAIPEDFDPFAEPVPEPREAIDKRADVFDFGPATHDQNIDDIFGLSPTQGADALSAGPLAGSRDDSAGSSNVDPMVAIGAARAKKQPIQAAQRDDAPEIYGSFRLSPVSAEQAAAPEFVRSDPKADRPPADAPLQNPGTEAAPLPRPAHADVSPASKPANIPIAASESPSAGVPDALLREFLAGAGMPNLQIPGGLSPELMRVMGQLFRESTQGTLDLLLARTTAKRELRSALTTIVARENNPLKFSPSVEAAMTHLLAPHQGIGFMSPLRALKDAYDDLRAHEFGFMAGMRAALAGALERFDPSRLERRLAQKSVLDALLPMNRQAKLWALFGELYADISREAEDNFHTLFGAEFLKAYEEQIAKLDQAERKAND